MSYRRNSELATRQLEREYRISGDRSIGLRLLHTYEREGKTKQAQQLKAALWIPVKLDLSFLRDVDITVWENKNEWEASTGYILDQTAGDFISPKEFIEEWIFAEWGSYEDHGEPDEGHVVNILQRIPTTAEYIQINSLEELHQLRGSLGSNTAGYNYTNSNGDSIIYVGNEGDTLELSEVYGEMSHAFFRRLDQIEKEMYDEQRNLRKNPDRKLQEARREYLKDPNLNTYAAYLQQQALTEGQMYWRDTSYYLDLLYQELLDYLKPYYIGTSPHFKIDDYIVNIEAHRKMNDGNRFSPRKTKAYEVSSLYLRFYRGDFFVVLDLDEVGSRIRWSLWAPAPGEIRGDLFFDQGYYYTPPFFSAEEVINFMLNTAIPRLETFAKGEYKWLRWR